MKEISLSQFIENTLVEVALGVRGANKTLNENHGSDFTQSTFKLAPTGYRGTSIKDDKVKFDIGVVVSRDKTEGMKMGVFSGVIGGGAETKNENNSENVHRVSFCIEVDEHVR